VVILGIDTSTEYAGVCLYDHGVLHEVTWRSGRNHTVQLADRLARMLREGGIAVSDLTGIAVAIGPGSFSGVRVGVAMAKSMALALDVPLAGIPTLDAIAHQHAWFCGAIRPVIDGGRGQIATALYTGGNWSATARGEPALADLVALLPVTEPTLFCGEVYPELHALITRSGGELARSIGPAAHARRAGFLAELAEARFRRGDTDDPLTLQPVYLRRPAILDRTPGADATAPIRSNPCPT